MSKMVRISSDSELITFFSEPTFLESGIKKNLTVEAAGSCFVVALHFALHIAFHFTENQPRAKKISSELSKSKTVEVCCTT